MRIDLISCGFRPTPRRPGARAGLVCQCRAAHRAADPIVWRAHNDPESAARSSITVPTGSGTGRAREVHAASAALRVTIAARDGCTVITAVGEADIATASRLSNALRRAPARAPVILDLTGVTFMDCTGLHPIVHAHRAAAAQHTPFILVPTPAITRLLRLADVQHILRTRATVPDAVTAASTG
jgi:anti-anti-sigma factor